MHMVDVVDTHSQSVSVCRRLFFWLLTSASAGFILDSTP
jgi:hypothetical protein